MGTLPDDDAAAFEERLLVRGCCMAVVEVDEELRARDAGGREAASISGTLSAASVGLRVCKDGSGRLH